MHNCLFDELNLQSPSLSSVYRIYKALDAQYINNAVENNHKFSGSCATTLVVRNNSLLALNVGDSRIILSKNGGAESSDLTDDHKPEKQSEFSRVVESGGELYRMSSNLKTSEVRYYFVRTYADLQKVNEIEKKQNGLIYGPWRVKPGGLSVSRSFGDVESKLAQYGGVAETVVSEPELSEHDLTNLDFALLGCFLKR